MTRIFYFFLTCLFFAGCTPVNNNVKENRNSRDFEGFLNEDHFQVICTQDGANEAGFREKLLRECREHLVITLAKYKIAYDYNIQQLRSASPSNMVTMTIAQRQGTVKEKNLRSYNATASRLVRDLNQIDIQWTSGQIESLGKTYGQFLPGKITREWHERNRIWVVYIIHSKALITRIKNTDLPFGLEFSN